MLPECVRGREEQNRDVSKKHGFLREPRNVDIPDKYQ